MLIGTQDPGLRVCQMIIDIDSIRKKKIFFS
jgi:hypothetical protein